jgi:hypothetical protein
MREKNWFQKRIVVFPFQLILLLSFCPPRLHSQTGSNFKGTVLDRSNFPIAGASIILKFNSQALETKSDSKGRFELTAPPGKYNLAVSARGFELREIKNFQITEASRVVAVILDVGPASDTDDYVVSTKPYKAGERLEGFVTNDFGAFINAASVTLSSTKRIFSTRSNPNGMFGFKHVPAGEYKLTISADGFQTKTIEKVMITHEDTPGLRITMDSAESP